MRWMLAILVVLASAPAAAAPDAEEILKKMEAMINGFRDQTMDARMTIVDTDGSRKSYEFTVSQKGDEKRMVRLLSGELQGMATLIESRDRVHVYLPGMKKVRRVATHNMNQSFAGSDMTNDDMASVSWTALYDAALDREDGEYWYLKCTPKTGVKSAYAKAIVKVEKARSLQMGIDYYDASNQKVKVWENSNVKVFHGVPRASHIRVSDPRTGHATELDIHDFRTNQGLQDSLFTVRELEWGK